MPIETTPFGRTPVGARVDLFTLTNTRGLTARITNWGAILVGLDVPDRDGALADVALGFDSLEGYLTNPPYFGATVGRVANRIAKARFTLQGREYRLAANDGENHLHGGLLGFSKVLWNVQAAESPDGPSVVLTHRSPDGEEGYPGALEVEVGYALTESNELRIAYSAWADRPTPVNLTHHSYWNLAGAGAGDVLGHELQICASQYTPVGPDLIPTGELRAVAGTPMDFTRAKAIGQEIGQVEGGGYDHNYALDSQDGSLALAARVREPISGRVLEIETTEPGIQLYTGNFLDGSLAGKGGCAYGKHGGFCLETQHYPDSINQPAFPPIVLEPGEMYRQVTVHRFSVE